MQKKVVREYSDGLFNWVDLSTPDVEAAKVFYTGLFGWDSEDTKTDTGIIYTMFKIEGHAVAGMGPQPHEMKGMPPIWYSYIKHKDVDSVVTKAKEAGATIIMPSMDVMDSGRMAMIQDTGGAVFGVWQPGNHIGASLVNYPNTFFWNELQTNDLEGCKKFYNSVFGWENSADESGYVVFSNNGRMQAGMDKIDASWGNVPPSWNVNFNVEDLEKTLAEVTKLGGSILVPATAAGDMGHFSCIQDPQGGIFTVMQAASVDLPPGY